MTSTRRLLERATRLGLLVVVLGALGACNAIRTEPLVMPRTVPLAMDTVPDHVKAVIAAVILRMRGETDDEVAARTGVGGSVAVVPEKNFRYEGFATNGVMVTVYESVEGQADTKRLAGVLRFRDGAGRKASAFFDTTYALAGGKAEFKKARARPIFARYPKVQMFVVPGTAGREFGERDFADYVGLYAKVASRAVPMRDPSSATKKRENHGIFVFFKDRPEPGSKFSLGQYSTRSGNAHDPDGSRYHAFKDGWGLGFISGEFARDPDRAVWIKAVYTPGRGTPEAKRTANLVGLFSTAPVAGTAPKRKITEEDLPNSIPIKLAMARDKTGPGAADAALLQARTASGKTIGGRNAALNQARLPDIVLITTKPAE